jgi:hypothetical protein
LIAPPVFIVACRRSGTTLLRTMLAQHPNLQAHPDEPQFILGAYQRFGQRFEEGAQAVDYVVHHQYCAPGISAESLPANPRTLSELIHAYLMAWCDSERQPVLKHPMLILHLDLLDSLFPNATIIHVVRDPRANVSSQRARWSHLSVWECASFWRDAVRNARRWAQRNQGRYVELQYEHLVINPQNTLRTLCTALRIPYTQQLLQFEQNETVFDRTTAATVQRFTGADSSRVNLWQERLSSADIRLIERCCYREMAWWDYALLQPPVAWLPYSGRFITENGHYQLKRIAHRLRQ